METIFGTGMITDIITNFHMNYIINIHNLKTSKYIYRARIEDNRSFKIDSQQQTRLTTKINLLFFKRRHFVLFTKP